MRLHGTLPRPGPMTPFVWAWALRRKSASRPSARATNAGRPTKNFKVLSYVPETKDFTFLEGSWAVEWRTYTASYVDSPGGEAKHARGTVLMVLKKLPDGSWKIFRAIGSIEPGTPAKAGGL